VDESACTAKKSCTHEFPWGAVEVDTYATAYCPDAKSDWYSGGVCKRLCVDDGVSADPVFEDWANSIDTTVTGPNAPVLTSNVVKCSAHTKGFPESIATQTASVACTTYDAEIYTSGTATLLCESTGSWATDAVLTGCVLKQCAVSGALPVTDVLATGTADCAAHDAVKYKTGQSVTADCTNVSGTPTWGTADTSACLWNDCATDGDWLAVADGADQTLDCATHSNKFATGKNASRSCSQMVWSTTINEKLCDIAAGVDKCTDTIWGDAYTGQEKLVDCATVDSALYQTGQDGKRTCGMDETYGIEDLSACVFNDCALDGVWPATANGAVASITCDTYDSTHYKNTQSATRSCTETVWGSVDVSACELAAGIFECAAADGYAKAFTGQQSTKKCTDLDGDYKDLYTGDQLASATCTNNDAADAAAFGDPDVSLCVAKQCLNSAATSYGFPDTNAKATAELKCELYNANYIAISGTDGLAKLDCVLATDGTAAWSDAVNVEQCEDTTASSARLCSIGAGLLSAACVAAVL